MVSFSCQKIRVSAMTENIRLSIEVFNPNGKPPPSTLYPLCREREAEAESRPLIGVWREQQLTTMLLDNGSADSQPHSHAPRLGSEEGFKNTFTILGIYPYTRVLHRNRDPGRIRLRRDHECLRMARDRLHGFGAVHDQIQDYLLQLNAVAHHRCDR